MTSDFLVTLNNVEKVNRETRRAELLAIIKEIDDAEPRRLALPGEIQACEARLLALKEEKRERDRKAATKPTTQHHLRAIAPPCLVAYQMELQTAVATAKGMRSPEWLILITKTLDALAVLKVTVHTDEEAEARVAELKRLQEEPPADGAAA